MLHAENRGSEIVNGYKWERVDRDEITDSELWVLKSEKWIHANVVLHPKNVYPRVTAYIPKKGRFTISDSSPIGISNMKKIAEMLVHFDA